MIKKKMTVSDFLERKTLTEKYQAMDYFGYIACYSNGNPIFFWDEEKIREVRIANIIRIRVSNNSNYVDVITGLPEPPQFD